jgi:thiamine pyrophosphokinase
VPGRPGAAVVFAAAPLSPTDRLRARLAELEQPFVVAADGGARTCLGFGLEPAVVIGDLDSIDSETRYELKRRGIDFETYPRDKDATDGQLAIERALKAQPGELLLFGFLGGPRLDQALANVLLLTRSDLPTVLMDERNECTLVRPGAERLWRPEPNELISLIPLDGAAEGVRTRGLAWPLEGEQLRLGDTRGISNEPVGDDARVWIEAGLLLVTRHFRD